MDRNLAARVEIETLHELLPALDYYQVLRLDRDASQDDVGPAFRAESRRLHPDRFSSLGDKELLDKLNEIFRFVREAYATLQDPGRRAAYDEELSTGTTRMTAEATARAAQQAAAASDPSEAATTEKASKYWKMGLKDFHENNFRGAVMNIQFALNFEPNNATFKEYLERARQGADEQVKRSHNPYKLRII